MQTGTDSPKIFVTDFDNIHFDNDGMGITIAFIPDDVDIATLKPPTAANLAQLGVGRRQQLRRPRPCPGHDRARRDDRAGATTVPGADHGGAGHDGGRPTRRWRRPPRRSSG